MTVVRSWLVCGDSNNPLSPDDRLGSPVSWSEIQGFQSCLDFCGLSDIPSLGCYFTWNNKQVGVYRVCCKLDRMLGNDEWMASFPLLVFIFILRKLKQVLRPMKTNGFRDVQ
ncbi:Ethanolamine ammonia-lyase light chain [Bienertia sinuspersici]